MFNVCLGFLVMVASRITCTLATEVFYTKTAEYLTEVPSDIPYHVQEINLELNNIQILRYGTFSAFQSCTVLRLSNNKISTIENRAFVGLTSLNRLYLNGNLLEVLEPDLFRGIKSLYTLALAHNNIKRIENDSFSEIKELRELVLDGNEIVSINSEMWSGLEYLQTLSLGWNAISRIENGCFDNLSKLQILYLQHNKLTNVSVELFRGLRSLIQLSLRNNALTYLPPRVFEYLIRLEILHLYDNAISEIDSEIFIGLHSLKQLEMSNNAILTIPRGCFENLPKLRQLILKENGLTAITGDSWKGLNLLNELHLTANHITMIQNKGFSNLPHLITLRLNGNNLETLNKEIWNVDDYPNSNGRPSRLDLALDMNPLRCGPNLCWIQNGVDQDWISWDNGVKPQCDGISLDQVNLTCPKTGSEIVIADINRTGEIESKTHRCMYFGVWVGCVVGVAVVTLLSVIGVWLHCNGYSLSKNKMVLQNSSAYGKELPENGDSHSENGGYIYPVLPTTQELGNHAGDDGYLTPVELGPQLQGGETDRHADVACSPKYQSIH